MIAPLLALAAAAPAVAELRFADEPWRLALQLDDMKPFEGAPSSPGRRVFSYSNGKGWVLSVIVENAQAPATLAGCRDVFDRRKQGGNAGFAPVDEVQGQRGDAATQEFDVKGELQGRPFVMHNSYSCRVRGTYYIDVHASKIPYLPSDHDALWALVDRVKIIE